jgi:hypothetical protein
MALQILLIAGGSLGVLPLSGVVTPFLSYGRSSMLANFSGLRHVASPSPAGPPPIRERNAPFRAPVEAAGLALGALALIIAGKAAYVQVLRSAAIMGEGTLVVQADGARRYQYNPRFQEITRDIPKGSIYDRNGLPLATSNWDELEKHRAQYQQLGINIDQACSRTESRHYPVRRPDVPPAGRSAHAHPLGRRQYFVRGARFGHAPARLRRPPHAGGCRESQDRQDGARGALRPARAGSAAAAPLRSR